MIRKIFCIALFVLMLTSCRNKKERQIEYEISGQIVEINSYGQAIPNFSPADMKAAGFEFADLIEVTIGDDIHLMNVPYVSSYNEVAILGPSYVDYNARGEEFGFSMLNGDFHHYVGGKVGDKCTMKLTSKGGYSKTYDLMKSVYPVERRAGESAEVYANFRMVTTSNIASGVLYRSSNPLNCVNNPGRYRVVDSLARVVGVKTEIDLADTPQKIETYLKSDGYASSYCPKLYSDGNTIACGMSADVFGDDFKAKLGSAVKFMIAHKPPYLIHCNEGKDRCGFVTMVFEAFAGADVDELRRDYMVTMLNFYKIPNDGESYKMRQSLSIDRMIWLMENEDALERFKEIDWDSIDISNIDWEGMGFYTNPDFQGAALQAAARKFLMECGVTADECDVFKAILTGNKS